MSFFNQYPYININDLNLDFILNAIKEMKYEVTNFVSINAIKYADPIQWNITSQYEKNTIVIDPQTGTAYISVAPVPSGVALTREEYWTVVFDLGSFVTRAAQNFTRRWESETTTTATFSTPAGAWLVWGDVLYKALVNITAGDAYVIDSNIEHITIEDVINTIMQEIATEAQARQDADTALQGAIDDEVQARQDAINDEAQARQDADTALQGAIATEAQARQDADTALQGAIDDEVRARQNADSAINTTIGDLNDLDTTDKSSVVNAINEALATAYTPDRRYITLADSYGEEPSIAESWQSQLSDYIESPYPIINLHEGSTGIYHVGNNGHNAETLLSSNSASITNKETVTDIIIGLGVNDWNDSLTDVERAYTSLIAYIRTNYVNAKIWFAFTGNNISWYGDQREKLISLLALMTAVCAREKCYFMDGVQYIMHNQRNVSADNVHPTLAGARGLAVSIAACLKYGYFDYVLATSCTAALTGGGAGTCKVLIDGNVMSMNIPDLAAGAAIAFTANTWLAIGTIANPVIHTMGAVPVNVQLYSSTAGAPQTISLLINKDTIYGKLPVSITLANMQVNAFNFTVPSLWS